MNILEKKIIDNTEVLLSRIRNLHIPLDFNKEWNKY